MIKSLKAANDFTRTVLKPRLIFVKLRLPPVRVSFVVAVSQKNMLFLLSQILSTVFVLLVMSYT